MHKDAQGNGGVESHETGRCVSRFSVRGAHQAFRAGNVGYALRTLVERPTALVMILQSNFWVFGGFFHVFWKKWPKFGLLCPHAGAKPGTAGLPQLDLSGISIYNNDKTFSIVFPPINQFWLIGGKRNRSQVILALCVYTGLVRFF